MEQHRNSTRQMYHCVWKLFNQFFLRLDTKPDTWEEHLVLFTGFLVETDLKSSTVRFYISAIRSMLMETGTRLNENRYLLNLLTKACRLKNDHIMTRLPIHKGVLQLVLNGVHTIFCINTTQPYLDKMYSALFMAAYYGLLRIGEVTKSPHVILARNVHIGTNKDKILFLLESSKTHTKCDKPQMVKISSRKNHDGKGSITICPFAALRNFIKCQRQSISEEEPFFIFQDRSAVTAPQARKVLKNALIQARLDPNGYFFHCFCSGRAGDLLDLGVSVETIKNLGRWKSNVVFTYLRS